MIEIITDWRVLIQKATDYAEAKKLGDKDQIKKTKKKICLSSDKINLGFTKGSLYVQN